jgi:hypothetical protein
MRAQILAIRSPVGIVLTQTTCMSYIMQADFFSSRHMDEKESAVINVGHRRMIRIAMQLFTTGKQENKLL